MSPSRERPRGKRAAKQPAPASARPAANPPGKPARPARAATRPAATKARKPAPAVRTGAVPPDSEATYRAVLEQASDAIFVVDEQGRFLDVNPRCCELFGYEREELLRMSPRDMALPEDLAAHPPRMAELLQGRPVVTERPLRRKDGSVFTAEASSRGLAEGRIVTILRDVTEQRSAEEALRQSEARYRAVLEQASDAIFVVGGDGRILDVNPCGCEILGYTREEVLQLRIQDTALPEDLAERPLRMAELLAGRALVSERPVRRKDGSVFTAEISARGIPDGRIVTILRDVTERRRAEQALRESEARYRALVEHASDGIFIGEGGALAFTEVNPSACEMLGYTREELLEMTIPQLIEPRDLEAQPVRPAGLNQEPTHRRRRMVRKDGTTFVAEIGARLLPDGRFMAILRDVTERERAEQALRASEARYRGLYESMRDAFAIVDMTGRILEFNEVFRAMLGYGREELLARTYQDLTPERWHAFEARILEEQVFPRGYSEVYQKEYRHADGTVFPVELRTVLLRDETGTPYSMWATVRDVSARTETERALRVSEARSRALFEHATDGIFVAEGRSLAFVEVNSSACEMLGYTREELLGMTALQLIEPRDLAAQPVQVDELGQEGPIHRRRPVVRKDGTVFVAEMVARVLPDGRFMAVVRDVTERERAEQALRESEARYRALVEQASDGITITGPDWRFLDVNPRFCDLLGYSREELLGLSVRDIGVREDLEREPLHVEELAKGETILTERRMRRKDGTLITVEISARDPGDGTTLSVVRDITERRRAEQALRDSEERFRRVFESEMMGMVFGLQGGAVADANAYFLRLVGYTRNDLLAGRLRWNQIMPPELAHRTEEAVRQAHETGISRPFETEFIGKDGARVPVLCGAAFIGEAHNFGVGFAIDLSSLRRAEQRLADSERYLERAQELAHIGTWAADVATMTGTFSDEMRRIYGRPPGERSISYADFIGCVHAEDRAAVEQAIRRAIEEPVQLRLEHRIVRPDGTVRVVEATSETVVDASGRPTRVIGSTQDVTERRLLELQLREAQKLEAIGRLAGGVAHDFNNLLTVILGFTETLLESLPKGDERRATAEQIRLAGRRAAGLTQQLLAFGRKQVFRLEVFDLNVVLEEMREILQQLAGERIAIAIRPIAARSLIKADRGQIEQVVLNLALNARDAMPGGGRLEIATSNVEHAPVEAAGAAGAGPRPWLLLAVSDTGTGMTPEVQAHIFEPFFTTKGVGQGTGLGLATVYGIVSQTGGHITVNSAPGKGTTLRVLLPTATQELEVEPAAPVPAELGGDETVLLVEDEKAVRTLVADVLRRRGYRVIAAADGEEAIEAAQRFPEVLHLLITDLVMPGMTGRELARFLVHERPGLKVLFISGYSDQRAEPRDVKGGGAFLQKPFTPVTLSRLVRQLLDAPEPPVG